MQHESTANSIDNESLLIDPTDVGIREAADLICTGKIVAFPTETVYGLGANALNENAVLSIFVAKGRPLTDPLIVHIDKPDSATKLVQLTAEELKLFTTLSKAFWPGPLTMITKSSALIPAAVTANTGTVGIRCPAHPIAQRLLSVCGLPIAAPSANRFGHVSPTKASHVIADLGVKGVKVIDGESEYYGNSSENTAATEDGGGNSSSTQSCSYGIESTVTKIDGIKKQLIIFRQGAITQFQLQREMDRAGLHDWSIEVVTRTVTMHGTDNIDKDKDMGKGKESNSDLEGVSTVGSPAQVDVGQEAPGQAVTHYAPDVPCYIVQSLTMPPPSADSTTALSSFQDAPSLLQQEKNGTLGESLDTSIEELQQQCVIIDFGKFLQNLEKTSLAYCDLSPSGNPSEAARNIFSCLRWAETVPSAKKVLISRIIDSGTYVSGGPASGDDSSSDRRQSDDMSLGVADRVFRAASGKSVHLEVVG